MNTPRDAPDAFRPVVDGVHRRHDRKQHLRGADVRGRLLAANVLLARLEREPVGRTALRIDSDADEAARHAALQLVTRGEIARVGTAETHRHAEALRASNHDIRAPLTGRLQQRHGEEVGGRDHEATASMDRLGERRVIAHVAVRARVLDEDAEGVEGGEVLGRKDDHVDAERRRARGDHVDCLRQYVRGDAEASRAVLRRAHAERHRFGRGRRLVQHRCVRDRHAGEVRHHRLEVEQCLEAPLGDLRLVRRVSRVPGRILEDVPLDHARRMRAVVPLPDERLGNMVLARDRAKARERFGFRERRADPHGLLATDRGRNDRFHERCTRRVAQRREHRRLVFGIRADVARLECAVVLELGKRRAHAGGRSVGHESLPYSAAIFS
jgi:hypothetical protein